jgi:hypothetical protein
VIVDWTAGGSSRQALPPSNPTSRQSGSSPRTRDAGGRGTRSRHASPSRRVLRGAWLTSAQRESRICDYYTQRFMTRPRWTTLSFVLGSRLLRTSVSEVRKPLSATPPDGVTFLRRLDPIHEQGSAQSWLAWPERTSPAGGRAAWWAVRRSSGLSARMDNSGPRSPCGASPSTRLRSLGVSGERRVDGVESPG